jgi:hypothetical protein
MLRLVQEYAHIVTAHGKSGIDITFHDERLAALIADVRRQALQEAAKQLDEKSIRAYLTWKDAGQAYYEGFGDAMDEAAAELRAMIGEGGGGEDEK